MSVDEDTELRDLVAQTLESNGVLGKIRAQLRSSVFLALEEQESAKKDASNGKEIKNFLATKDGRMVTSFVREFLQYFQLDYTLSVFDPEIGIGDHCESRTNLAREYDIIESDSTVSGPLIAEIIKRASTPAPSRGRLSSTTDIKKSDSIPEEGGDSNNKQLNSADSLENHSDFDDDSFFDDPKPSSKSDKKEKEDARGASIGMSSLSGLPSLNKANADTDSPREEDIKEIDKRLSDIGFDIPDDDYDEDFESSNISPTGPTPRSARSDHNVKSLDEEIDEDFSVGEDLLKSDNSAGDDLTTDRTVSPTDHGTNFDYMEEVIS